MNVLDILIGIVLLIVLTGYLKILQIISLKAFIMYYLSRNKKFQYIFIACILCYLLLIVSML